MNIKTNNKVLVIAPHPDDETLGAGGSILKHKAQGDKIFWLILTNIHTLHGWESERVKQRQEEMQQVAETYQFNGVYKLDLPTTKLDEQPMGEIISKISAVIKEVEPSIIYLQNRSDVHSDHRTAFDAIMACTKSFRFPYIKRILMYETITETDFAPALPENQFIPNVFIDISEYIDKKIDIMKIYASEIMEAPMPRSLENIRNMARYRGARIGVKVAEAFQLIFEKS